MWLKTWLKRFLTHAEITINRRIERGAGMAKVVAKKYTDKQGLPISQNWNIEPLVPDTCPSQYTGIPSHSLLTLNGNKT